MLASQAAPWRIPQAGYLVFVALLAAAAGTPAIRARLTRRPAASLALLVALDLGWFLWGTIPFVPIGIDESLFQVDAEVLRGADLAVSWIRTPLPIVGAAACPAHPPLVGLLARELAIVGAYVLARRGLGPSWGLLAAFWTAIAAHLAHWSGDLLSEPYGAAALAWFAVFAARGPWPAAAVVGGLGFASRYQLGVLLLPAAWVGWRRGRWLGAFAAPLLFFAPVAVLAPWTGVDPWRAFMQESQRTHTILERVLAYASLDSGFGLNAVGMILAAAGAAALVAPRRRLPELCWSAALFALCAAAVLGIGVITTRFFAPAVPFGVVLMVVACRALMEKPSRWLHRGPTVAGLLVVVTLLTAIPARLPKNRYLKQSSPVAAIRAARAEILTAVGSAPIYTDVNVLATTAALGHPCHAVLWERADHPAGVSLDWDGRFPVFDRTAVPAGAFYLTREPDGRAALWAGAGLGLVRW